MFPMVVLVSMFVSWNSARAARLAQEGRDLADQMQKLYELSRRTLQMNLLAEPGAHLAELVREIFSFEAVALFDADLQEVYEAGAWNADPAELAQNVYHFETVDDDPAKGVSRRVIRLGSVSIGSLVVRGQSNPLTNSSIAALIAITFDRYHAVANEGRIEAERKAEQLRAAVLDNLAHAYKTPLTAIRAASSGLSAMGRLSPGQAELVSLIEEQASLLNELTTRLLTTARLDRGDADDGSAGIQLHATPVAVGPLVDEVVSTFDARLMSQKLEVDLPDDNLILICDRRLIAMLLTQYLDNACKYSDPDTAITLRASQSGEEVVFSVHSFGPTIAMADRERLFDRYFRSSTLQSEVAGTGIGLSIAKRVAVAHQGTVWVASDDAQGTTFYAAIPARKLPPDSQPETREAWMMERSSH